MNPAAQLRALRLMLSAGCPLDESLRRLATRLGPLSGKAAEQAAEGAGAGQSWPEVLGQMITEPAWLRTALQAVAGEASLSTLHRLAELAETYARRRLSWRAVAVYPAILTLMLVVNFAIGAYVVNQYGDMFPYQSVPALTRILLWAVQPLHAILLVTAVVLPSGVMLGVESLRLHIPILGVELRRAEAAMFVEWLGFYLETGQPLPEAVEWASQACMSAPMRRELQGVAEALRGGSTMSEATETVRLLPENARWLLAQAETRHFAPGTLHEAAAVLRSESDSHSQDLVDSFQPVLMVVSAGFILLFVVAFVAPMFSFMGTL